MRTTNTLMFAALFAVAVTGVAQAETIKVKVQGPISAAEAQAGEQALRAFPATADVYVSTSRSVYAVELKKGGNITDSELTSSLAGVGETVAGIKRSNASFATVKASLKPTRYRYFKWN